MIRRWLNRLLKALGYRSPAERLRDAQENAKSR
jgi:hypothetical protein